MRETAIAKRPEAPVSHLLRYTKGERIALGGSALAAVLLFQDRNVILTAGFVIIVGWIVLGLLRGLRGVPVPASHARPVRSGSGPIAIRPRTSSLAPRPMSVAQRKVLWATMLVPCIALSLTGAQLLVWGLPLWIAARLVVTLATRMRPSLAY